MTTDFLRFVACFVKNREYAKASNEESPPDIVLRTVPAEDLNCDSTNYGRGCNEHGQSEDVYTRADCGRSLDCLEIYRKIV